MLLVWTTIVGLFKIPDMATKAMLKAKPHFDSLEQEAFLGLWRTYDRLRALEDELFARYDLTPQQYNAFAPATPRSPNSHPHSGSGGATGQPGP